MKIFSSFKTVVFLNETNESSTIISTLDSTKVSFNRAKPSKSESRI